MPSIDLVEQMWKMPDQPPPIDLSSLVNPGQVEGRVVVITGANVGLGLEAARHFANLRPARLILGCRNEDRGNQALRDIKLSTGFESVELRLLDVTDFQSVVAFADGIAKDIGRLDILISNAGMSNAHYETTRDGFEIVLQTNSLGPALLTLLLLPILHHTEQNNPTGPRPRIVNVGSIAHQWTSLDEDLSSHPHILRRMSEAEYCTPAIIERRYADTKLLNIWFSKSLQALLEASGSHIITNSLNPGFCVSNLSHNFAEDVRLAIEKVAKAKAYTTEEGSRFLVQAALLLSDDQEAEQSLRDTYFDSGALTDVSAFSTSEDGQQLQRRVWKETLEELSKIDSRVLANVEWPPAQP